MNQRHDLIHVHFFAAALTVVNLHTRSSAPRASSSKDFAAEIVCLFFQDDAAALPAQSFETASASRRAVMQSKAPSLVDHTKKLKGNHSAVFDVAMHSEQRAALREVSAPPFRRRPCFPSTVLRATTIDEIELLPQRNGAPSRYSDGCKARSVSSGVLLRSSHYSGCRRVTGKCDNGVRQSASPTELADVRPTRSDAPSCRRSCASCLRPANSFHHRRRRMTLRNYFNAQGGGNAGVHGHSPAAMNLCPERRDTKHNSLSLAIP